MESERAGHPTRRRRPRAKKRYFPRVDVLSRYEDKRQFRRRFRLNTEIVEEIAADFGRSEFAPLGCTRGGGLSHVQRVSRIYYEIRMSLICWVEALKDQWHLGRSLFRRW